jgi:hypothetical protein
MLDLPTFLDYTSLDSGTIEEIVTSRRVETTLLLVVSTM